MTKESDKIANSVMKMIEGKTGEGIGDTLEQYKAQRKRKKDLENEREIINVYKRAALNKTGIRDIFFSLRDNLVVFSKVDEDRVLLAEVMLLKEKDRVGCFLLFNRVSPVKCSYIYAEINDSFKLVLNGFIIVEEIGMEEALALALKSPLVYNDYDPSHDYILP